MGKTMGAKRLRTVPLYEERIQETPKQQPRARLRLTYGYKRAHTHTHTLSLSLLHSQTTTLHYDNHTVSLMLALRVFILIHCKEYLQI